MPNEHRPWLETGETELEYFQGLFLEEVKTVERLRAALTEISKGEGRFSMDNLEFACNTIEDMKELAVKALETSDAE